MVGVWLEFVDVEINKHEFLSGFDFFSKRCVDGVVAGKVRHVVDASVGRKD